MVFRFFHPVITPDRDFLVIVPLAFIHLMFVRVCVDGRGATMAPKINTNLSAYCLGIWDGGTFDLFVRHILATGCFKMDNKVQRNH